MEVPGPGRRVRRDGEITRRELASRGPLFLGRVVPDRRERAVAAVARAANSGARGGWHRARTLKLSGWWDDSCSCARTTSTRCSPRPTAQSRFAASYASRDNGSGAPGAIGARARDPGDPPAGPWSSPVIAARTSDAGAGRAHGRRVDGAITCADSFATTPIQTTGSRGTPPRWRS